MAQTYRMGFGRRLLNAMMRGALWIEVAPQRYCLLTVSGRRTGKPHATPVTVTGLAGAR